MICATLYLINVKKIDSQNTHGLSFSEGVYHPSFGPHAQGDFRTSHCGICCVDVDCRHLQTYRCYIFTSVMVTYIAFVAKVSSQGAQSHDSPRRPCQLSPDPVLRHLRSPSPPSLVVASCIVQDRPERNRTREHRKSDFCFPFHSAGRRASPR